jgi:hypothetical protein
MAIENGSEGGGSDGRGGGGGGDVWPEGPRLQQALAASEGRLRFVKEVSAGDIQLHKHTKVSNLVLASSPLPPISPPCGSHVPPLALLSHLISSLSKMVHSHPKNALLGGREMQLLADSRLFSLALRITNASSCSTRPPLAATKRAVSPHHAPRSPPTHDPTDHPAQASLLEELAKRGYPEPLPPLLDTPASLFTSDGVEQLEQAAASAATVHTSLPTVFPSTPHSPSAAHTHPHPPSISPSISSSSSSPPPLLLCPTPSPSSPR